jgi:SAM-dependent methyltransferase
MKPQFPGLQQWILRSEARARAAMGLARRLNVLAVKLLVASRKIVSWLNAHLMDGETDRRLRQLPKLHADIQDILARQKAHYEYQAYAYGYPYQAFATLGIFGDRPTEERFDIYRLRDILRPDDTVLDVGCNCGFMAVYASYRTGCRAVGIDINPYMIEIGERCAQFLRVGDRVSLAAMRFQEFSSKQKFSVVFSFATHWTDDGNYRVALPEHLARLHSFLQPGGLLVFESHCADVGSESFYAALEAAKPWFDWDGCLHSDNGRREVYLMRARPQGVAAA